MQTMTATRIELKKDLPEQQVRDTCDRIRAVAGEFRVVSTGNNPLAIVVDTANPQKIDTIAKMPSVAKVMRF